jgi:hypothetical protein
MWHSLKFGLGGLLKLWAALLLLGAFVLLWVAPVFKLISFGAGF